MPDFPTTAVAGDCVAFRLADPGHELAGVRLWADVDVAIARDFVRRDGGWELGLKGLPLDRIEYLYDLDGRLVLDPGNPLRVGGAFGDHSWLPLAGYAPPGWLAREPVPGSRTPICVRDTPVGEVAGLVWAPDGFAATQSLPLLISHDGAEMDAFGALTQYAAALVAEGRLPPLRVALLAPGDRNPRYAANGEYAAALIDRVLPEIQQRWATRNGPVLMGQSLGALAALHAAWTRPGLFGGLFLQSGSYFTQELDPQESGFSQWDPVTRFVRSVHETTQAPTGALPATLVCGTAEENLANNRLMAHHLAEAGMTVAWGQVRDGHNWTCWRDLLDPHLTDLLTAVWS